MIEEPKQARSERTLHRILDATEALLETQPFDRLSIQDITGRAGIATGSFYTRFENKAAVLEVLFDRYLKDTERIVDEATGGDRWSGLPLKQRVPCLCELMVRTFRARRGVSRSAQLHYLRFPEHASAELRERLGTSYEKIARVMLGDGHEIMHSDPRLAAHFAVQLATAICRARILFSDHPVPDSVGGGDDLLVKELSRALLGYLTADGSGR